MHGHSPMEHRATFTQAATAGALGAAVGLGIDELAAGVADRPTSLLVAVGTLVIDAAPGGAIRVGIDSLGQNDKPALLATIAIACILLGGAAGAAARRGGRSWLHPLLFGSAALLGAVAAARLPGVGTIDAGVHAVLAGSGGFLTSAFLVRRAPGSRPGPLPAQAEITGDPLDPPASRRSFLTFAGLGAVTAVGATGVGRQLRSQGAASVNATTMRAALPGPAPGQAAPAVAGTLDGEVAGLSPWITPTEDFYRIDTALVVPRVDVSRWHLDVDGLVDRPLTIGYDELLAMPMMEEDITLACVSNEVGGDLAGTTRWLGVPLSELLARAGVQREATQVMGHSVDGFTAGFPRDAATDGRAAMVAVAMGGEALPARHGFPARIVVPGLYGYVSATKWLRRIELTTWEGADGFWIPRGWSKEGPMKTQSRIDVPRRGEDLRPGPTAIAGVAWAPLRGIEAVEVRVDDGPWQRARLGGNAGPQTWVQWVATWVATAGEHRIVVRATDGTGTVQTDERQAPAPDGATGHHSITVEVS